MNLSLESLSVDIAGNTVLRNIDLCLREGRTVAVIGRNGAGKTTLLRTLMGLVRPSKGRLLLAGQDITALPAWRRAGRGFGYAPEDRIILPTLSVQENVLLPCQVLKIGRPEVARRLEGVLAVVPQLKAMLGRSGAALSGGQGKIVALARSLMVGDAFVFLDEPFQGLAPALAEQYGQSLRTLRSTHPQLCVVVTESNAALLDDTHSETIHIERGAVRVGDESD